MTKIDQVVANIVRSRQGTGALTRFVGDRDDHQGQGQDLGDGHQRQRQWSAAGSATAFSLQQRRLHHNALIEDCYAHVSRAQARTYRIKGKRVVYGTRNIRYPVSGIRSLASGRVGGWIRHRASSI